MKINVLTNYTEPNSRAFNTPLALASGDLKREGYKINFIFNISKKLFNCDALFINSNFFRYFWKNNKNEIFKCLETASEKKIKIFWFDTTDSTWITQFEVMPFVDKFLKSHILKDKSLYLKNFRTGRIFTDFFDSIYNAGEKEEKYPHTEKKYLEKISISWAPCFENYNQNRYSFWSKVSNRLKPKTVNFMPEKLDIRFVPPQKQRSVEISARFGLSHSRPSVVAHRKAVADILHERGVDTSRIPLPDYFEEMRNAKISVSPFGVGEFCYRDYESIVCGATLLKPDMSHLETWPDFYKDNETYIAHKWDLSDLNEKIDFLLNNDDYRLNIAENAAGLYSNALSASGIKKFSARVMDILDYN